LLKKAIGGSNLVRKGRGSKNLATPCPEYPADPSGAVCCAPSSIGPAAKTSREDKAIDKSFLKKVPIIFFSPSQQKARFSGTEEV
jgi:hypothetical protein